MLYRRFVDVFLSTCGSWSSKRNSPYLRYKSESYILCVGKHMHDVKFHSRPRSLSLAFFSQLFSSKQLRQSSANAKKNMIAEAAMYYHITFFHYEKPKKVSCFSFPERVKAKLKLSKRRFLMLQRCEKPISVNMKIVWWKAKEEAHYADKQQAGLT